MSAEGSKLDKKIWHALNAEAVTAMQNHVFRFVTPISRIMSFNEGRLEGSGSYVRVGKRIYLCTNAHVAETQRSNPMGMQFSQNDVVVKGKNKFRLHKYPVDFAKAAVTAEWKKNSRDRSSAIPFNRFAKKHDPIGFEILFLMGFSQDRSQFITMQETLHSRATPFVTQEYPRGEEPEEVAQYWNSKFHFTLNYNPAKAESVDGTSHLPRAKGLSGSLVWNTRRLEYYFKEKPWKPDVAKVTGIIWGWPEPARALLATRVEHFRGFL